MIRQSVRLSRSWVSYQAPAGLELLHVIEGWRYRLRLPTRDLTALDALRAGVEVSGPDQLTPTLALPGLDAALSRTLLAQLDRIGALVRHPLQMSPDELYSRQIRYFLLFERDELTAGEMLSRLQKSRVVVVGVGGLGSWLLLLLSRIGVRSLVGVDADVVERSNLSRQVLFDSSDVGGSKAVHAERMVRAVDDQVSYQGVHRLVRSPADLLRHLDGADLVVNPFGYPPNPSLEVVDEAAWRAGTPSLLLGGSWVGPLTADHSSPCYRCLLADPELAEVMEASQGAFLGRGVDDAAGGPFAPRIAATASVAVSEIALHLSGARRARTTAGVVALDLFDFARTTFRPVAVQPSCRCQATAPNDVR